MQKPSSYAACIYLGSCLPQVHSQALWVSPSITATSPGQEATSVETSDTRGFRYKNPPSLSYPAVSRSPSVLRGLYVEDLYPSFISHINTAHTLAEYTCTTQTPLTKWLQLCIFLPVCCERTHSPGQPRSPGNRAPDHTI